MDETNFLSLKIFLINILNFNPNHPSVFQILDFKSYISQIDEEYVEDESKLGYLAQQWWMRARDIVKRELFQNKQVKFHDYLNQVLFPLFSRLYKEYDFVFKL